MELADLVVKLGLSAVVVLWVLATFTRELRDLRGMAAQQAAALAALQKTQEVVLALLTRQLGHPPVEKE